MKMWNTKHYVSPKYLYMSYFSSQSMHSFQPSNLPTVGAPSSVSLESGTIPKVYQVSIKSVYHLENSETYYVSFNKRRRVVHECRLPELSDQPESIYPVPGSTSASTRSLPVTERRRSGQSSARGSAASLTSTGSASSRRSAQQQGRPQTRSTRQTTTVTSPSAGQGLPSAQVSVAPVPFGQVSAPEVPAPPAPLRPSVHPMDAEPSGAIGQNILFGAQQLPPEEQLEVEIGTAEELAGADADQGARSVDFLCVYKPD